MSDDLGMHAAFAVGDLPTRLQLCLQAGCELVLVCRPEDVAELLPLLNNPLTDAGGHIARLYGCAQLSGQELAASAEQGAAEWTHWRSSLETLNQTKT